MEKLPQHQQQIKFLPHFFKFIGGGIMLLGLILIIANAVFGQNNIIQPNIPAGIFLCGFILFAYAKGKIKNEVLMKLQHQPGPRSILPNYFKKIGIGTILFAIIVFIPLTICLKKYHPEAFESYKRLFGILIMDIILIGFLLYAGAKEKVEDELIVMVRMKSMAFTFLMGVSWIITKPIADYIFFNQIKEIQGMEVIMFMIIFYTILFHFSKKNR